MEDILFTQCSSREGREVTVRVAGEIDMASAPCLWDRLEKELGEADIHLTLDFSEVSFVDSEGIKVLAAAYHRLKSSGGEMSIVGCGRAICRVFEILGISGVLGTDCAIGQ
jgi:anti-sigma B factor antagonist